MSFFYSLTPVFFSLSSSQKKEISSKKRSVFMCYATRALVYLNAEIKRAKKGEFVRWLEDARQGIESQVRSASVRVTCSCPILEDVKNIGSDLTYWGDLTADEKDLLSSEYDCGRRIREAELKIATLLPPHSLVNLTLSDGITLETEVDKVRIE